MPFIPHTDEDIQGMLAAIGAPDIETLFAEIPTALRYRGQLQEVPDGLSEMEVTRLLQERADADGRFINFIGAGAYEHHIPAAVWQVATRGEFYTSYTPYQAEASQGTLLLLYEFQTMIAELTGLEVANASLYDGASALAEAVLMAVRLARGPLKVLLPVTLHPRYREVVMAIVRAQGIELVEAPMQVSTGTLDLAQFAKRAEGCAAVVIPQPNFFGMIEDVDALTAAGRAVGALVIGVVNPIACALLAPPGEWAEVGADIAVGEGQPLGVPLASGGPYLGFMACKKAHVRQMPGRIIGRTTDLEGRPGYVLTLQAREQHIRRSKATSNICTNQGLLVTAATIHVALLGAEGLERVARACHANTVRTVVALTALDGVDQVFSGPYFHECVLRLAVPAAEVLRALEAQGIIGGLSLTADYPELGEAILICATETRTAADIHSYAGHMERIVSRRRLDPPCAVRGS